jgi:transcriptional regulator with XRE-family HTH domain
MPRKVSFGEKIVYGQRLTRARDSANVNQRVVADAIDCTQGFISRVEAGQMMLQAADYPVIAKLLGVSVEDLLGQFTPEERAQIEAAPALLAEERRKDGYGDPSAD